jgi:threonine/homoserine/homoserine lactone efflux protein
MAASCSHFAQRQLKSGAWKTNLSFVSLVNELPSFLLSTVVISLTGVMSPGPVTAATLAAGARHRHAGAMMAVGHGVIELPLVVLIVLGLGRYFQMESVRIAFGLIGGVFLLVLGVQMIQAARRPVSAETATSGRSTFMTGLLLTACNPYFLLWWATVGLALATQASQIGLLAFALFAIVHWLCDLFWLEVLSQASFRGGRIFSAKSQPIVLGACGAALLLFAARFSFDAVSKLMAG